MAADADVSLPDLVVIQRFSLAVRAATAPRSEVIAALEADLAYLRGSGRDAAGTSASEAAPARVAKATKAPVKAPRPRRA